MKNFLKKLDDHTCEMNKIDYLIMGVMILLYGFISFYHLGDIKAPKSYYTFNYLDEEVTVRLKDVRRISKIVYYTGNNITVDIVKKSVAISFYKMIFSIFLSFINIFDLKNESLIFTQFILGCIISGILSIYLIFTAIVQVQK